MKRLCPIHGYYEKQSDKDRCPKCTTQRNKTYDNTKRNQESNKFYHSKAWKSLRSLVLSNYPFCVDCGKPAQMVDHKVAIKDNWDKRLDEDNLQPMCNICHNRKENQEGNRWKRN